MPSDNSNSHDTHTHQRSHDHNQNEPGIAPSYRTDTQTVTASRHRLQRALIAILQRAGTEGIMSWIEAFDNLGGKPLASFLIKTTHPSDNSGVAFLSRHFAEMDTINEAQAMVYGIGRLSARVFDLNEWYKQQGMARKIVCVKKPITKANGRKAYVTDYYKLEVTQ